MNTQVRIALVQCDCSEPKEKNLQTLTEAIHQAAGRGAELIVLPELHNTFYFCQQENPQHFELAEPIPGPSTNFFGQLAQQLHVVLVLSLFEKRAPGLYHNTAVVIEKDGSIAGRYRKMHIPQDPGFCEKFYFTPGDLGFKPIQTSLGCLGILICWDQWFPEAARLMALAGANLLIYPTAIGWDPCLPQNEQSKQKTAWQTIQRAHAIGNGIPVLICNRTGFEAREYGGGIQFWGSSFVSDAQGEIVSEAPVSQAAILVFNIDYQQTEHLRRIWPYLRDRRIDAYGDLTKRFL